MRLALALLVIASGLAIISPANAWYDRYGYWHPSHHYYRHYVYVPPPYYHHRVYVAPHPYYRPPPPVYYRP
jgi:hypothetical protein